MTQGRRRCIVRSGTERNRTWVKDLLFALTKSLPRDEAPRTLLKGERSDCDHRSVKRRKSRFRYLPEHLYNEKHLTYSPEQIKAFVTTAVGLGVLRAKEDFVTGRPSCRGAETVVDGTELSDDTRFVKWTSQIKIGVRIRHPWS